MSDLSLNPAVQGPAGTVRVERLSGADAYPLTPMQQAMLLQSQREPRAGFYVQQFVCTLREPLRAAELRAAWQRLTARHPVLRTSFLLDASPEPLQRVHAEAEVAWREEDWRGLGEAAQERALQAFLREDRATPFDPAAAPLARCALFRLEDQVYRLVWTSHHALFDGHARRILLAEVFEDYAARLAGREAAAAERRSFGEYVDWLAQAESPDDRAFWEEELRGFASPNEVVLEAGDGRREGRERHTFDLSEELTAGLQRLAQREEVTLNTVLQAAWALLLSRYTGDPDVVFGATRLCRRGAGGFAGAEGVVGLLSNTVPVRVRVDPACPVTRYLDGVRALWLRMRPHERTHLSRIQEWSELPHGTPLFQTMFGFETETAQEALHRLGGEWRRRTFALVQWTRYPLVVIAHGGAAISIVAVYDPARFGGQAVRRMGEHFVRVLRAFVEAPGEPLGRIEILSPAERRHLLEGLNPPAAPHPGGACVHALLSARAARSPDAVAVAWQAGEALTYGELERRSNQLARALRRRGVGPEVRVGVCMERSPELVITLAAILKAGGAYVPLDPGYPPDRLAFMLEDAEVALLLSQAHLAERLPAGGPARLIAGPLWAQVADESAAPVAAGVDPRGLAYVIYTSGSTGRPKGVAVPHRALANHMEWMQRAFPLEPSDRVLQKTPLSFDASVWEFWAPLLAGATLVLAGPEAHRDPAQLLRAVQAERVTVLQLVPSVLQAVLDEAGAECRTTLRRLYCGGEALPAELARRARAVLGAEVVNLYGPTEVCIDATAAVYGDGETGPTMPIGRPVDGARACVLDPSGRPVPVGIPGELYLGGAQVARGYVGRPGLTAERFVPDPFGEAGARLYRTGDRVRWLSSGELEFLGRVDEQVKVRGFRIEPGEVESALLALPGVREAVVVAREDRPGEARLVAYLVGAAEAGELRARLRQALPEYMVPSAFVSLESLPLTANGKLDRRALPVPESASAGVSYVAPRTPVEELLAGIWAEVLRLERVGVHDDFFELGGHSLLVMRVLSRVREGFGVELPVHVLFDRPTVAEAAAWVEEARRIDHPVLPPLVPVERTDALPLSFAQERLWFLDRLTAASALYNIPVFRRLKGALDVEALERALGEVVRRHEVLRTTFREMGSTPAQIVAPFDGFVLPVDDFSALDPARREAEVRARAAEEAARPFDLSAGPLFRARLLRLGPGEHVLLVCMHHIVGDGWSLDVLLRELPALYGAYREGGDSPLAEPAVQYADYAVWQRRHLGGGALERQLAWWRDRLAGAPGLLELPTDHPRPAVQTHRGAYVRMELSAELLERLRALGRSEGATLFMVLLGAFQVLLAKYAGSDDVVVGTPVAGRTRQEVEGLIGFFVNTLVLRTDLSGDPPFRALLRRVREASLGAYEHQEVPFERLVAELQPERSLSHAPLFQVTFTLRNAEPEGLPGLDVVPVEAEVATSKFDLSLGLEASADGLRGGITYSTDLFERGTVERMAAHLGRVLEQVAADAEVRLSGLALMGEVERAEVVEEWIHGRAEFPTDHCVHDLFATQAERTPDAVAVACEGVALTYRELDERAARLARHLRALGVGPEVRVGLCLERSPELVVALLAVLKAGGAYVPLDPAYPPERIAWLLEDSGVLLVLAEEATRTAIPAAAAARVLILDDLLAQTPPGDTQLPTGLDPQAAAYVIYTSGSTGRPKGVVVSHANVVRLFAATDQSFGFGSGNVWTLFHSYAFDFSVWEIWGALLYGGRLVVVPFATSRDPVAFRALLARERVTVLNQTPSAFRQLVHADEDADDDLALKWVVFGGEALDPRSLAPWFARHGDERPRLVNMYGITETTVHVTWRRITRQDAEAGGSVIGAGIADLGVYLLDARQEPTPPGVPGEIFVGGAGVARGYLGRPALTAERFVPDPFAGVPGARMYRSGDRARRRAEGDTEYLGRGDQQVKVRGFRIEPGEVESALVALPGVREAVVVAREDRPGEARLVAYLVGVAEAGELRVRLRQALPEYMVPSSFVTLDALPLTSNGKLDRRALPVPEEYAFAGTSYVAPRTPVEELLAGIWCEVLGVERVGADDNFFELGGHSLLVMRVLSRVREGFEVELPVQVLFERPTVAELAAWVEEARRAELPMLPPVVPVGREGALPLSLAQERLWFLDRLTAASALYNIPVFRRLEGALDVEALARALGEAVRRHEVLRTTFPERDGAPVQVVASPGAFALSVDDLSGLPAPERETEAKRRAAEEAARPFDLSAGPLFRARLLRLGPGEHVLLVCMHHIVGDGWSLDVLLRELPALYGAYREGGDSPLAEPAVQYADYAVWQRRHLGGGALEPQLAWWRDRLAGAPGLLELPTDHPRPAVQTHRGAYVRMELSAELLERLRALGRSEGTTLFMVLLGAFQVLLAKYAGSDDVVVGTPVAGRTRQEVEGLIGFFVNTLVLRTDLSGDPPFRALLRRVREASLGAYEHQEVPFERLVAELQPERSLSHAPLFQVTFTLRNAEPEGLPGLDVAAVEAEVATSKFDLSLGLEASADGLRGGLTYSTDLFERGTVERMAAHLGRVLEQVAADAEVRLSGLALMGEVERAEVVEEWIHGRAEFPTDHCVHDLFAAQAERTPDAVAVACEGVALTYRELDERAARLARHLRALGVGPEVRVGLCLERSLELVVALLAVLKAGGAYVPLDPAYPPERIAWLLEDSGVLLVLAEEATRTAIPAAAAARVLILDDLLAQTPPGDTQLPTGLDPQAAAYVIYTSGSTGRPKGVVVSHANVVRLFPATDSSFGFGPEDVWTLFHSYAFDFSVWEIWGALLYGGRLVVVPFATSRDPVAFRALLARERVTVLNQTPSAFRQLVHADDGAADELALRWVVFGGEALEPRSLAPWFARHGDERPRLVNMYGITETTVHVTWRRITRQDAEAGGSVIGAGIADLGVYLLDARQEPTPPGVPGEIFVGGAGVARGYLGRPALTAERFVPDPFAGVLGARMYRSGDRARRRAGGDTEYLGRGDQQVKVRGFRIEPGEIESALVALPGVREAVVVAREDEPGVRRLVAYVVATDGEVAATSLRAGLAARLPDHMVPAAFVPLDAIPLTAHGKVDRRALPAPDGTQVAASEYVPPRGVVEETLAWAWAETLGVERVGADDNYFALGGDSMRAIQVLALARSRGVPFSLQELFHHQTVAELAARIRPADGGEGHRDAGPFALLAPEDRERLPAGVEDAYPMTQLQLGMVFHTESNPDGALYHNVQSYLVRAAFDEERLRGALATLAARHPVLRTSFDLGGFSEPMQLVHREVDVPLTVASLAHLDAPARDAAIEAWMQAERLRAFDWRVPPLIRFHIHTLGPDAFQLGFTEHHAILDGWSVATLLTELSAEYFGSPGARHDPPPPTVLPAFVALEREALASAQARAFWAEALADAVPTLPAPLGPAEGHGTGSRRGTLPAEVTAGLTELARREGLPLKSLLLAAHLRVLAAAAGTDDVVTGVVSNGRPEGEGAERALGLFLNTVPLRLRLSGESWLGLVRAAFAEERRTLPFRRFPMAELQRMRGGDPPCAAFFNFVHFHVMDEMETEGVFTRVRATGGTDFPFGVSFEVVSSGVNFWVRYDAARFSDAEAEALAGRYQAVLAKIAADPRGRYDACDLLSDDERARIVGEWGVAGGAAAEADTLDARFAAQARRTPHAVAVACGGERLTYAELDRRSARLADALRRRGVGPEVRVGVCLERSTELVVALLATLRAGGAYLPLDPGSPAERLAWMLADAAAPVVVTRSRLAGRLAASGAALLRVDADREEIERGSAAAPPSGAGPENLAYVIYTSGSTGTPKGVGVSHRSACAHLRWIADEVLGPGVEALPATTRVSFDASLKQLLGPLLRGKTTWILDDDTVAEPEAILRELDGRSGLAFNCVPSLWSAVLDAVEAGAPAPAGLGRLLLGGEAFRPELVERTLAVFPELEVWNLYGPTETTVNASAGRVHRGAAPTLGRPAGGARAYVVDGFGGLVPAGVPGELWVAGDGVARGYLGRPRLTAEKFAPDPFSTRPGARLYRTGDRVRWLPSGELEFLGRMDAQVKVRGHRVEPGEVEAALASHPAVRDAAVEARADGAGERRLVAYLVAAPDGNVPSPAELRAHLRERLPEYMVPFAFVALDEFPVTSTGKLDRRALPAPEVTWDEAAYVAPRDALELQLANGWQELLGVGLVGVRDDFFALGGHSLLALRLVGAVERLTGRRVPMATLLAGPTVGELARALRADEAFPAPGPLVPLHTAGAGRPLFLVHAAGGNVASYAALARHLGPGRPCYGLQSRGLEGEELPHQRVEEMAADYLAEIRAVQPEGPYRLGGWSMGGLVAFEMARRLEAAGEAMELLAVVDSKPPVGAVSGADPDDPRLLADFLRHLGLPPERLPAPAEAGTPPSAEERLWQAWEAARAADLVPSELDLTRFGRLWGVFQANVAAAASYRPGPCASDLLLIVAESRAAVAAAEADRWRALSTGTVRSVTVPGDHFSLVREPHVRALAAVLAAPSGVPEPGLIPAPKNHRAF